MRRQDIWGGILAGLIGALVMTLIGVFSKIVGLGQGPEAVWAAFFGFGTDKIGWSLGFVTHLIFGALAGVLYGWLFEVFNRFIENWFLGVILGSIQAAVLGFLLALSPKAGAILFGTEGLTDGLGIPMPAVIGWFLLHIIFGIVVWTLFEEIGGIRRIHKYTTERG